MSNHRGKNWVFTINNYEPFHINLLRKLCEIPDTSICQYIIWGYEKGDKKHTPHLQGYIQWKIPRSLQQTCLALGGTAYCAFQRAQENWMARNYCLKSNNYEEYGLFNEKSQGKRNDIDAFRDAIQSGMSNYDLIMNFSKEVARYPRFLQFVRSETLKEQSKKFRNIHTTVFYGGAGLGKTRSAWEKHPSIFKLNPSDNETLWFDGYDGEKVLLIDDFDGQGISYKKLLQLLDGYQCRLPIKGGFTYACWEKVIITSQNHPINWFPFNSSLNEEMKNALFRRIHKIKCFINSTRKSPYKPPKEINKNYIINNGRIRPVPLNFKPKLKHFPTTEKGKEGAGNNTPPHG